MSERGEANNGAYAIDRKKKMNYTLPRRLIMVAMVKWLSQQVVVLSLRVRFPLAAPCKNLQF